MRHSKQRTGNMNYVIESKPRLLDLLEQNDLMNEEVVVRVGVLTPEEAIGRPIRTDFPILIGKEKMIEARFRDTRGQAFTDSPGEFAGSMRDVLELPLTANRERAIYIAVLNAVMRHLDMIEGAVHCKDEDPEKCADEMAQWAMKRWPEGKIGLIGCNPAILEALVSAFGPERMRLTDLNPDNIGKPKFGVEVWDGNTQTGMLAEWADALIVTGTTLVNDTLGTILSEAQKHGTDLVLYGVTAAGICELFGIERVCFYGR